jgi:predicted RNA binding protein YcfA (HicA-like mRNA interferase family)
MTFNELVRRLEKNGFSLVGEKGSVRYYRKAGWERIVRVDYHGKGSPFGNLPLDPQGGRDSIKQ